MHEWPPEPKEISPGRDFPGQIILAVDPSMNSLGLALAQADRDLKDFIQASYCLRQRSGLPDGDRIKVVAQTVRQALDMWPVDRIVVECPTSLYVKRGRSMDTLKVLLVIGAVQAAAGYMGVPVHSVTVRDWKGRGSVDKEHSIALGRELLGVQHVFEDEVEACLLALYACKPTQMVAAFQLMKLQVGVAKAVETFGEQVKFGPNELTKLEEVSRLVRLTSKAKKRKP